ncbi:uncharacterized protein LOC141605159 isoform X1 [Silene latifolia]|uniref:uncharacterized protein LOC141605159 isoform X1 n=2 Tax=Silene latifolia TaxID=37657 RepID=UPI003D776DB2
MRAIFCGNLEFDARQSELERLFKKYGTVDRVDMKSGFAFVYMEDERDAEEAVRKLDRVEFGRKGRRLRVEWTKQERDNRRPGGGKKPAANERPSRTLFVINFDPIDTKSKDLERHFEPYGRIANIRIRKNFAFIQFETQEEATKALEATNMSELLDRVITVEYAIRDDDVTTNGQSLDRRGRDRELSPERGGFNRRRSPSPYRKERGSPDYGRGRDRGSPDYGRGRTRDSPDNGRGRVRGSPDRGPGRDRRSPDHRPSRDRGSPDRGHGRDRRSPDHRPSRDRGSPVGRGRDRGSPDRGRDRGSPNGRARDRGSPDGRGRDRGSPVGRGRDRGSPVGRGRDRGSPVGRGRDRGSPDGRGRGSPDVRGRDRGSPDGPRRESPEYERGISKADARESPDNVRDESPTNGRYHSRSPTPPARERSRS